jgi:adenylosuccinate lyase
MTKGLVGDQWYEGDVSCSVVRRVALPGAFFALDGLYESAMTVLDEMELFPGMIAAELRRFLPFLSTTNLLVAAFKKGMGREKAHSTIKKHAQAAIKIMRDGKENPFVSLLDSDESFPLTRDEIERLMEKPDHGCAPEQIRDVCARIKEIALQYPVAAQYKPLPIL